MGKHKSVETYGGCKLLPLTLDLMVKYPWQETNFWLMIYACHSMLSCSVTSDSAAPWTVACQAPLFMGILQARILEWVAMPFSTGSSQPRDQTQVSCIAGRFFTNWATSENTRQILIWCPPTKCLAHTPQNHQGYQSMRDCQSGGA